MIAMFAIPGHSIAIQDSNTVNKLARHFKKFGLF